MKDDFVQEWRGFKDGDWCVNIDVRNFIMLNVTPYDGDEGFLKPPTARTARTLSAFEGYLKAEAEKGGVLDIDTVHVSSLLSYKNGYIKEDDELIYGLQTEKPLMRGVNPFGGIRMAETACRQYGYKLAESVKESFKYRTTHNDGVFRAYGDEMKAVRHAGLITGLPDAYGRGRIIGDYRRIALYGMDLLITAKKRDKTALYDGEMTEEVIRLSEEISKQIEFMEQLKTLASNYGFDISVPASTAREAVQWLYFGYLGAVKEQNGAANSIGRISAFLDIYFERDIKEGRLDEEGAQELIDDLTIKLRAVRHLRTSEYNDLFAGDPNWVTVAEAGMALDGRHLVTKTAYRILNTLYNLKPSSEPNITVLYSEALPLAYKRFAAKVSIDTGSIQYENDDIMRPEFGDDYAIACCVSAMKVGKQMQYFGARCNLPKLLLLALNGGRDEISGLRIAPATAPVTASKLNYDDVKKRFDFYADWLAKLYVSTMNIIHYMHDKYAYERLMMSFHDSEPERLMAFGIAGLSVIADSLSAIKYAEVTPVFGANGLIAAFDVKGSYPAYGNDDDRADLIAKEIAESFSQKLQKHPAYRGAKHTLSILTITSNVVYGSKTGATPDGRIKGAAFAPGANPMHNRDTDGAAASLNSVAKIPYECCRDGISNTFSVTPQTLGKNENTRINNLVSLLRGYFTQGAHHLNVNVLTREKLIDAMEHPENYPTLTIRVSGYAVNFTRLSRDHQLEVIARTFHEKL
ncbi:MAG: formate C-acetyltransferase [Clostridiaceae bacterium]|jgi:formate C-acetyltransferase|nr:formate C-acetyltransferase [Clostridiaceae bacterium]